MKNLNQDYLAQISAGCCDNHYGMTCNERCHVQGFTPTAMDSVMSYFNQFILNLGINPCSLTYN